MRGAISKVQTAFRLSPELIGKLKEAAQKENRSLNNYVECILMRAIGDMPNTETELAMQEVIDGKPAAGKVDMASLESFIGTFK